MRSRHSSMPLPSGRRTSSTATSGSDAGIRALASATVPASPTISRSGSEERRSESPRRTTSWSSTRNTLTMARSSCRSGNWHMRQTRPISHIFEGKTSSCNWFNDFGPRKIGPSADEFSGGGSIALWEWPIAGVHRRERSMADDGVVILAAHECWELLASRALGRLVTYAGGQPDIFPVNYVVQRRTVLFRTAGGTKLVSSAINNRVLFEADDHNVAEAWSVIVRGTARALRTPEELEDAERAQVLPWTMSEKTHYMRIV